MRAFFYLNKDQYIMFLQQAKALYLLVSMFNCFWTHLFEKKIQITSMFGMRAFI